MIRLLCFVLLFGTLAACQPLPHQPAGDITTVWEQHYRKVMLLDNWDISGKLAIRTDQQSASGTLFWLQRRDYFDLRVSGPLGQGTTRLTGHPGQIQLTTPHTSLQADSPEQLMEDQLGWSLPVNNLIWWVRGLPAKGSRHHLQFNEDNRVSQLEQAGWSIKYQSYLELPDGTHLPARILMSNPELQLTLVIKQWHDRTPNKETP